MAPLGAEDILLATQVQRVELGPAGLDNHPTTGLGRVIDAAGEDMPPLETWLIDRSPAGGDNLGAAARSHGSCLAT
jgi:hypothetical protein